MPYKPMSTSIFKFIKLACFVIGLLFFLTNFAQANSPAPPSKMWLTFDYQISQPVVIEGIQIVQCKTPVCTQPVLLHQHGICKAKMCLTAAYSPEWAGWYSTSECTQEKCYTTSSLYNGGDFKLIIQFSDRVRVSGVEGKLPTDIFGPENENGWRVKITDKSLSISADENYKPRWKPPELFFVTFGLTQIIELFVASILLTFWLNSNKIEQHLLIIFLANIVTFPLVWLFFPSLEQFQPMDIRSIGLTSLVLAISLSIMLILIYRAEKKAEKIKLVIATIAILGFLFVLCMIISIILTYRNFNQSALGLPAYLVLPLSEIFAVIVEVGLITVLSKKEIALKQAIILSLITNTASLVFGPMLLS